MSVNCSICVFSPPRGIQRARTVQTEILPIGSRRRQPVLLSQFFAQKPRESSKTLARPSFNNSGQTKTTSSRYRRALRQSRGGTAVSGLRLCVKDEVLQAYVLLATEGDRPLASSLVIVVEYPLPVCGHLVKLARKGFPELQVSSILEPQQVTVFPEEHMFPIVQFGLRPDASKHHIRVCACLTAQFAFFSNADSSVLLTPINAQASASLPSPSINPPRISQEIKQHPH